MTLVYQNNIIVGTTKVGTIKPDANGYREVVLGAFNTENSSGAFYPLEPFKSLLLSSSSLMRRINDRALRSEYGHPRRGKMSPVEFLARVMDIFEQSTCNHILKIELDENRVIDKNTNQRVSAVIGSIKPSGPYGDALEKQFENPEENVCFSIRSITNDIIDMTGRVIKNIKEVVTWDYVNEPGIKYAKKYYSPSISTESYGKDGFDAEAKAEDLDYTVFDETTILKARDYAKQNGLGNESTMMLFETLLKEGKVQTKYGTFYKALPSSRWGKR